MRSAARASLAVVASVALCLVTVVAQQTIEFGAYPSDRTPEYRGVDRRSVYVPMKDGVKLAVDVLLPQDLQAATKIPAIVRWTRYFRSRAGQQPSTLEIGRAHV